MEEVSPGIYFCNVCKMVRAYNAPVVMVRSGISSVLFVGGFLLLLLASVVFYAFPELEIGLTYGALLSLYIVYFGLAFTNFRRNLFG